MADELVNEDFEIKFTNTVGPGGDKTVVFTDYTYPAITMAKSSNAECPAGKKIIAGPAPPTPAFVFNLSLGAPCPFSWAAKDPFINGTAIFITTSNFLKSGLQPCYFKSNMGACIGFWTKTTSPYTEPCSCTFEITESGQTPVNVNVG